MKILSGKTQALPDVEKFISDFGVSLSQGKAFGFDSSQPITITRAPGRLDVMGGIADYSGALVLQMPIREATICAIQARSDRQIRITSLNRKNSAHDAEFEISLDYFFQGKTPIAYEDAQQFFQQNEKTSWAAYVAGAFLVLAQEKNFHFPHGATLLIRSNVPEGKGVSSSAALEVAAMEAIAALYNFSLTPEEIALLCQKVENFIVGAPCGVMDQMTAVFGRENELMALLCQPAQLLAPVKIPDEIEFFGLDSGVRHSVSGADYTSVRVGAFMGYRIIAELAGLKISAEKGKTRINDPRWHGYLANLSPSIFEQFLAQQLPPEIKGSEFLEKYGGITDPVTQVNPGRTYAVLNPTKHPIYENFRVKAFANLIEKPVSEKTLHILGELMYQSHAGYSACGLGSDATDLLVELARQSETNSAIFGAKITGGGSGGTVALLSKKSALESVEKLRQQFLQKTGYSPYLFQGSSPGSRWFGRMKIKLIE
ncbi:MAG: GHMP kinase [Calditrichaeota bacterium]|nr:GHMP kinase [Calditrichota bacterium]